MDPRLSKKKSEEMDEIEKEGYNPQKKLKGDSEPDAVIAYLKAIGNMTFPELANNGFTVPAIISDKSEEAQKQLDISRKAAAQSYVKDNLPSLLQTKDDFSAVKDAIEKGAKSDFLYVRRHTGMLRFKGYGDTDTWKNILRELDSNIKNFTPQKGPRP